MIEQSQGRAGATRVPEHIGRTTLARWIYPLRMLGMATASLPIAVVLHEHGWTPGRFALLAFTGLLWPQLAWLLARRSAQPFQAEVRNLLVDSCLAGLWVPLLHINLLPSVLLLTVGTADKIITGVHRLWLKSLPVMALGVLLGGLATGFTVQPHTSQAVILACLPLLVVHTLAGSMGAYRLIRMVQGRNRRLAELSQQDPLTGLANRRHWQDETARMLGERSTRGDATTLLMIDVDRLKAINDEHGHAAGDDVLRTLASLIHQHAGPEALAGRLGGDEFALTLPCSLDAAEPVAERLRHAMATAKWPHRPNLRCTISLGLSEAGTALHDWSEVADRALYRAKQAGRNRLVSDGTAAS